MSRKWLSTGQAAAYCSVTPDTVLKWIRSGILPARRTAGGHHRIDKSDLEPVLQKTDLRHETTNTGRRKESRSFRYCWEFFGNGKLFEGCRMCAVYQMRAERCYEVARLAPEAGHPRLFCQGTCGECDYYRQVHQQSMNVLVVTADRDLTRALLRDTENRVFNMEITDCEYGCSAIINDFRPDFAVIDCSLGHQKSLEICSHLSQDPRIPFVRVVLAANEGEIPFGCEDMVFARIRRPFNMSDITASIRGADARSNATGPANEWSTTGSGDLRSEESRKRRPGIVTEEVRRSSSEEVTR